MLLVPFYVFLHLHQHISMIQFNFTNQTEQCKAWIKTHVFENTELHLQSENYSFIYIQLQNFNELANINCTNLLKLPTNFLLINAEQDTLVEENIHFNEILNMIAFRPANRLPKIQINNILGFNQYANRAKESFDHKRYEFNLDKVKFDFYLNKTLITKETCKHENFYGKQIEYFWPMKSIFFNNEVSYTQPVCPYAFLNSRLIQLGLHQITNSLIYKNRLEFLNIDHEIPSQIGLNILFLWYLEITIRLEELSSKILYPLIFKHLTDLSITGSPTQIQTNLFENFTDIAFVAIYFDNLVSIFHNGLDWISYLNRGLKIDFSKYADLKRNSNRIVLIKFKELLVSHLTRVYTYPGFDLCLFKNFPHKQLVIPTMPDLNDANVQCTCTILWLIQNYEIYFNLSLTNPRLSRNYEVYFENASFRHCLKNYSTLYDQCHFEAKFNLCQTTSFTRTLQSEFTVTRVYFLLEWLKLIIEVYAKTFFSILGLLTNFLIMLVIKNRFKTSKKCLHNTMYEHVFFNSVFNFSFCLINSLSLMNVCVFPKSSFCSSVYKTNGAQYFKIVFVLFLGNSIRLCCNFSFIFFALSRLYMSTSKKPRLFLLLQSLNLKLFYLIMFGLSSVWSMFKLFEYKPNEAYSSFDTNFPYNRYDSKYCQHTDAMLQYYLYTFFNYYPPECTIFPILNLVNNILNNILFLFVSVLIDFLLVRFANKNYQHKKQLFHDKKDLNEALEHKKKIKKLVITNGVLYSFSHIPQFILTLFLIVYKRELEFFCYFYFSCTGINDLFETFGFVSISLQFFVYYHFDLNFYHSFKDLI
jgi:hypothetical protein